MSYYIKHLSDTYEIECVLNTFSACLRSLSSGKEYIRQMAEKFFRNGNVISVVDGEKYAGFAAFYSNDQESKTAYLSMIAVLPEYRGKQLGCILLDKCIEMSAEFGMRIIRLEVHKGNTGAISFYEKNGFQYAGNCTDVSAFMEKAIIESEKNT